MRRFVALALMGVSSFQFPVSSFAAEPPRPNVIFMLCDDMGYSDISCYGSTKVSTPNIDRLAAEGMKFTDFHVAASICSPSRSAFMTGAYPQRNGLYMGINPNREAHWFLGLNPDEITIAEQFKSQGYITSMIGKWHLGAEEKFSYFNQGFDHYYGMHENKSHDPRFFDEHKLVYKNAPLAELTSLYTERIVTQIGDYTRSATSTSSGQAGSGQEDQPFFIYYAHNYPHTPYAVEPQFKGSSKDGVRGDVIQGLDWSVGEIVKALEANGILDNTLIIFSSDNGPVAEKYAKPYSGTKYVSMEGGQRVPFIIYWKGKVQPAVSDVPVIAMDLFPTLSELIGAPMPADRIYDGVTLTPLFNGGSIARSPDEPFYYYNCENLQCVRMGDWKLHVPREKKQFPFWSMKLQQDIATPQLYNLATDQGEKNDVAAQYPERVAEMMALVEATRLKLGEFGQRGSEQRATGTLFPDVPIIGNHVLYWDKLTDAEKGPAKTEFTALKTRLKKSK
jgi:arylsulfatase A-like enzyme